MSQPTTPISYTSKADAAYDALRQQIVAGILAPGAQLNQAKLAAELDVSATPLREALRRLEADGLVRAPAHRDAVVAPYDPYEVRSLLTIRGRLNRLAVRLAAKNHDAQARTRIEEALRDLRGARTDPIEANRAFHRAIFRASGNRVLIDVLDGLWDRLDRFRRFDRRTAGGDRVMAEHEALALAIFDRDVERADDLAAVQAQAAVDAIRDEIGRIEAGGAPRGTA